MDERGGTVFSAPAAWYVPAGRLVDPATFPFWVTWEDWDERRQEGVPLARGGTVDGADAAIAWGRERCDRVLIRLGHTLEGHFSAGHVHLTDGSGEPFPVWPPDGPPPEGWWTQSDEAAASREPAPYVDPGPPGRQGVSEPEIRIDSSNGD